MSKVVGDLQLKVERAKKHLSDFETAVFRNPDPNKASYAPSLYHDGDRKGIFAKPHHGSEPDIEWGIVLGDVFHQLRATLDHMLYAIAAARRPLTNKEARNLHFPIFEDETHFDADWRVTQNFWEPVIGTDAFAELKLTQPYQRYPIAPMTDPLWRLHKLDAIDKHRTILVLNKGWDLSAGAWPKSGNGPIPLMLSSQPVKPGAELFAAEWPDAEPPREVYVKQFSSNIVFTGTDGLCDGASVIPTTQDMIATVSDVIDRFWDREII